MSIRDLFSEAELEAIRSATAAAERETSGEVVTYVVARSASYEASQWQAATLGALLLPVAAAAVHLAGGHWGGSAWLWGALPAALGAAGGYLAMRYLAPLRRLLSAPEAIEEAVRRRAAQAFLEEEVFRTRDRTGILLFLSLFERRVVVLADSGINARVQPEEWEELSDGLAAGVRAGRPGQALVEAIDQCGDLLRQRGVAARGDDEDELRNELRLRDE